VFGVEDKPIALAIKAALREVDPDAVLSVTISGIPSGVTLSAGTHNADGSVTLTPAQLAGLTLTSDGEAQHFDLTVTATAVDGGNTATAASLSGAFHVGMGDKLDRHASQTLEPGGFVSLPATMRHFAWTATPTVVQISLEGPFDIFYVNPADNPQKPLTRR